MKKIASRKNRQIRKIKINSIYFFVPRPHSRGQQFFHAFPLTPINVIETNSLAFCRRRALRFAVNVHSTSHEWRLQENFGHERFTLLRTCLCFVSACPRTPFNVILNENNRTWNSTHFLMNFHDDLHPPDPNQCQICKNLSFLEGGRAIRASDFVPMTLIGVRGNAWKKHCHRLWGLRTKIEIELVSLLFLSFFFEMQFFSI